MHIRICDFDTNHATKTLTIRLASGKKIFDKVFCESCANGLKINTGEIENE